MNIERRWPAEEPDNPARLNPTSSKVQRSSRERHFGTPEPDHVRFCTKTAFESVQGLRKSNKALSFLSTLGDLPWRWGRRRMLDRKLFRAKGTCLEPWCFRSPCVCMLHAETFRVVVLQINGRDGRTNGNCAGRGWNL